MAIWICAINASAQINWIKSTLKLAWVKSIQLINNEYCSFNARERTDDTESKREHQSTLLPRRRRRRRLRIAGAIPDSDGAGNAAAPETPRSSPETVQQ